MAIDWMSWGSAKIAIGMTNGTVRPMFSSPVQRDWEQIHTTGRYYSTLMGFEVPSMQAEIKCKSESDYYALEEEQKNKHALWGRKCYCEITGSPQGICDDGSIDVSVVFKQSSE